MMMMGIPSFGLIDFILISVPVPNEVSSATRRTGRTDCNGDAHAGLDVMMG
ncbi:MAG: hypothetical protein JWR69_647 [Pedosphaera sp.]|nr:hypothetical protein [Pedosphaera sp.]